MRSTSLLPNPMPRRPAGSARYRPSGCGFSMCMARGKIRARRVPASSRSSPTGRCAVTPCKSMAMANRHATSVHVEDVADALLRAWRLARSGASRGEVFNVCTGQAVSIARLARKIIALTGRGSPLRYAPFRVGDVRQSVGDPRRARDVLGFRATTTLADGLTSIVPRQQD